MPRLVGYPLKLRKNVSKKHKDAVREAKDKLRIGQEYRRQSREDMWRRSEMQYSGDHWNINGTPGDDTSDLIVVNKSFSTINVIQPYVTGAEPRFLVEPFSGDATPQNAAIQQALLNRLWRSSEISGQEHLEVAAGDFLIYGDGYLKVGFDIETSRTGEDEWVDIAKLWINRVDPWDMWIDPSANGMHDARWVCQKLRLTKAELEESDAYSNIGDTNVSYGYDAVTAEESSQEPNEKELMREVFDGSEWAVVYEFYDLIHNKMISFSTGELPIRWVDDIGASTLVQLGNYRIFNSPYHMGELEQIWELQSELNRTRSHLITHRRRGAAKVFAKENALDDKGLQALQSPTVMEVAFVKGDQPLADLVMPVSLPNLSADVYNVSEMMENDIYDISGVNEYLRGEAPNIRRTATEASIIEGASNIKSQFKLRQIEKASKKVGTLMLQTARDVYPKTDFDEIQLYLSGKDADLVQNAVQGQELADMMEQGAAPEELDAVRQEQSIPQDVTISPGEDIFVGEYEVKVAQQSTELRNPQVKAQKFRQMAIDLISLSQLLALAGVNVNYKKVLAMWFEAEGIEDVDTMFGSGPPPQPPPPPQGPPQEGQPQQGTPPEMSQGFGPQNEPGQPPGQVIPPELMGLLDASNTGQFPPP